MCQDPRKIQDPGSTRSKIRDLDGSWILQLNFAVDLAYLGSCQRSWPLDPMDPGSSTDNLRLDPMAPGSSTDNLMLDPMDYIFYEIMSSLSLYAF